MSQKISLRLITNIVYFTCGKSSNNERIARSRESITVAVIRNFSTFLLLRYISPPPPKTGESPPSGACKRIEMTRSTATTICAPTIIVCNIVFVNYTIRFGAYLTDQPSDKSVNCRKDEGCVDISKKRVKADHWCDKSENIGAVI